ncbi:unnamed protein product [Lactuca virosa]|uniref:Uncharacterized protein n=1 Tax=Lactuca virosa TaxID=75947 RepID=A0AAU9NFX7_9ASTR|nr:unnamed protein product [Lactuca virosa]
MFELGFEVMRSDAGKWVPLLVQWAVARKQMGQIGKQAVGRKAPDGKEKWNATRSGSICSNRYIENSEGVLVCEEDIDENERLLVEQPVGGWLKKAGKGSTKAPNGKDKGNPTRSGCTCCDKLNEEDIDIDNERLLVDQQIAWDLWKNTHEVSKNKEKTKIVNSDK